MINIKFLKDENRSVIYDDFVEIGECNFLENGDIWNIVHTGVDSKYQGQGLARKLVECVIENSKKFNKTLVADCSYARKVIEDNNK